MFSNQEKQGQIVHRSGILGKYNIIGYVPRISACVSNNLMQREPLQKCFNIPNDHYVTNGTLVNNIDD